MATPAWYNENANRDWPFITRVEPIDQYAPASSSSDSMGAAVYVHLPHSIVVDFGAIMEIDAEYNEDDAHIVYLYRITRVDATTVELEFRTTAPQAANYAVTYTRDMTDPINQITWTDAGTIDPEAVDALDCQANTRWQAFIVTGDLSPLTDLLDPGDDLFFPVGLWTIEPSRIQSLMGSYLRACNLANFPRTGSTPAPGCGDTPSDGEREPVLNATCIAGDVTWEEGYNCIIRQDTFENSIIVAAGLGSGAGAPCEEVPLSDDEVPPDDSTFLSGGPACNEVLQSLNGVTGRRITLVAGNGVTISPDPDIPNRLIVDRSLTDFAACVEDPSESSSNSSNSLGEEE